MFYRFIKIMVELIIFFILISFLAIVVSRLYIISSAKSQTYSVEDVPKRPIAIIFGAGLWSNGRPSPVLRDRVATAADLYFQGKVEKLLMSGDNSYIDYNEPGAMTDYAIELGVPEEDIVQDYAGRRTYDTCYRAKEIFRLGEVILVTQNFHLPRAIYTCSQMGLDTIGVPADRRKYHTNSRIYWEIRESFASLVALWEVNVSHPQPILGKQEPIFPPEER